MRRRAGTLVPLEVSILEAAIELRGRGMPEVYGFRLAKAIRQAHGARRLTAYGTLYKALDRLAQAGYLTSRWEDPQVAATDGRPRRRFYRVTPTGGLGRLRRTPRADQPASLGSGGPDMTPGRSAALVRRWVALYTVGLPRDIRDARRAQLAGLRFRAWPWTPARVPVGCGRRG